MLTEEQRDALLEFEERPIGGYSRSHSESEHAETFETHLVAAHWLDHFRESLMSSAGAPGRPSANWHEGFEYAMKEIAAHLRLGDFLPGAQPYEQTVNGLVRA